MYVFIGETREKEWVKLTTSTGARIRSCVSHAPEIMQRLTTLSGAPQRIRAVPVRVPVMTDTTTPDAGDALAGPYLLDNGVCGDHGLPVNGYGRCEVDNAALAAVAAAETTDVDEDQAAELDTAASAAAADPAVPDPDPVEVTDAADPSYVEAAPDAVPAPPGTDA